MEVNFCGSFQEKTVTAAVDKRNSESSPTTLEGNKTIVTTGESGLVSRTKIAHRR